MPNEEFHQHYLNATVSDNSIYTSQLRDAVEKGGVCNIAVTGPYGSGKTTVINTFLQNNSQYKVLRISLAKLEKSKKDKDDLELCILQQMFYQAKGNDIPNSRFSRITCLSNTKQIWYTVLSVACISALVWLKWQDAILDDFTSVKSVVISIFSLLLLLGGLYFLMRFLIRKFSKINIKQLVVDKLQLNVSGTNQQDVLNKYLDEILYYFKMKTIDIVVFEDLDRYKDPDIFIKLRELNTILNHSEDLEIKKKGGTFHRKITFIYALKDGIFGNDAEQLVKFFDYILPVVPYVNVSNSGDKMIQILDEYGHLEELGKDFINDFSPYIKDMRVIYNICNEYEVYRKMQRGLKPENLMALTVYKNLYPDNFDKVYSGEGTVCDIFKPENKEAWQEERRKEIEDELLKIENRITEAQKEFMKDDQELKFIMVAAFFKCVNDRTPYGYTKINDLLRPEIYNKMINGQLGYTVRSYIFFITLNQIESAVSADFKYSTALESIQNKQSHPEHEKEKLQSELNALSRNTMKEMCDNDPKILEKLEAKTKDEPVLYNFIRKGYINENYDLYISLFHEGDITQAENQFVITVKRNQSTRGLQPLINVESVVKRLNDEDFNHVGTLQFQIAVFLSEHYKEYKKQADGLFQQMKTVNRESWDLLMDFLNLNKSIEHIDEFLCLFIRLVPNVWEQYFDIENPPSEESTFTFLNVIFCSADIDDISNLNSGEHSVAEYVSEQTNYDSLFENVNKERIEHILEKLPLCIKHLKDCKNRMLNEQLIARNLYDITLENIQFVLQFDGEQVDILKLKSANYTTILASKNDNLKKYIEDHFQEYLQNVFFSIPENTDESEDAIFEIVRKDSLSVEDKAKAIIQQKKLCISNIQSIVGLKKYWSEIIPEHVVLTQKNFETFYAANGMCEAIESWMKDASDVHLFLDGLTTISSNLISYYTAVLEDDSISPDVFKLLVNNDAVAKCLPKDLSKYDEKHLLEIVKSKAVAFSKEYYDQLLDYNDVINIYVLNHIKEFIETLKANQIVMSALLIYHLLQEDIISEYKTVIISKLKAKDVNKENAVLLADYYISHSEVELNKDILIPVITQCEDSFKQKAFIKILAGRKDITKEEILAIITSLKEKNLQINVLKNRIDVSYDEEWNAIAQILKSRGFISKKLKHGKELAIYEK